MNVTPEQIRDIAVKVIEDYINKQVPMNCSIAQRATDLELNPEQIKRVIEAANSIGYLKLLSMAQDRTFEFPVASYEEVMKEMTMPEISKEAQVDTAKEEILPGGGSYLVTSRVAPTLPAEPHGIHYGPGPTGSDLSQIRNLRLESIQIPSTVAPTEGGGDIEETTAGIGAISEHEKKAYLMKQYIALRGDLEKIAMAKEEIFAKITDTAAELKRDPEALEKIATVTDTRTLTKMAKLLGKDTSELKGGNIYVGKELEKAAAICVLYGQALKLAEEEKEKLKLEKRAASIIRNTAGKVGTAIVSGPARIAGGVAGTAVGAGIGLAAASVKHVAVPVAKKIGFKNALGPALNVAGALSWKPKVDVWDALHG